jgi:hypothetical protein
MPFRLRLKTLMHEPLVHFLGIGLLLFGLYAIGGIASFWVIDRIAAFTSVG